MTIGELREWLGNKPADTPVILIVNDISYDDFSIEEGIDEETERREIWVVA